MRITLIGNYAPDGQQSMLRYARLLHEGLTAAGHQVRLVAPRQRVAGAGPGGMRKWLGYLDKYLLGLRELRAAANDADLVHVCDHSSAVYIPRRSSVPWTVTCHDLIAVRAARGEIRHWRTSPTGRLLQRAVLRGLGRARAVACVSRATQRDFTRLLPSFAGELQVVSNALHFDHRLLSATERDAAGQGLPGQVRARRRYLLHVGSAEPRKNRATAIRALAALARRWDGMLVFAGDPLSAEERQLARDCGVSSGIVEVVKPSDAQLRLLYNDAAALVFPSLHEGFGWPLLEAQACGCPVICSDREPMPEVTGDAALFCAADDAAAFAARVLELEHDAALRGDLVRRGLANAAGHSRSAMIGRLEALFERAIAQR